MSMKIPPSHVPSSQRPDPKQPSEPVGASVPTHEGTDKQVAWDPGDGFVRRPSNAQRLHRQLQPQLLPLPQRSNLTEQLGQPALVDRKRPDFDTTRLQGLALAAQLQPTGAVLELFRRAADMSGVASAPAPEGRFETGYADRDLAFQKMTRSLVSAGRIKDDSFVVMFGAHVIPQADELLRAPELRAQGSFVIPSGDHDRRVAAQAQTWGDRIHQLQHENAAKSPGALFLGIDSDGQKPLEGLPTAAQLKARGITNVPVLLDTPVGQECGMRNVRDDLRPYLEGLQRAGLQVTFHGLDGSR